MAYQRDLMGEGEGRNIWSRERYLLLHWYRLKSEDLEDESEGEKIMLWSLGFSSVVAVHTKQQCCVRELKGRGEMSEAGGPGQCWMGSGHRSLQEEGAALTAAKWARHSACEGKLALQTLAQSYWFSCSHLLHLGKEALQLLFCPDCLCALRGFEPQGIHMLFGATELCRVGCHQELLGLFVMCLLCLLLLPGTGSWAREPECWICLFLTI